jgi:quinol monooxygenase YgiN
MGAMAIRIVSNVTIDPDHVEDYLEYWPRRSAECRAERGALQYQVFRSIEYPNEMALLELWADQESYDEHWAAQSLIPNRPQFPRAPRATWRDGLEFYFQHQYFKLVNNVWVPE